jgi:hypothetical protein
MTLFPFPKVKRITCYGKLPHKLAEKMWLVVVGTRDFSEGLGRLIKDSSGAARSRGFPPVDAPIKQFIIKWYCPYEFSPTYSNCIQSLLRIRIRSLIERESGIRIRSLFERESGIRKRFFS